MTVTILGARGEREEAGETKWTGWPCPSSSKQRESGVCAPIRRAVGSNLFPVHKWPVVWEMPSLPRVSWCSLAPVIVLVPCSYLADTRSAAKCGVGVPDGEGCQIILSRPWSSMCSRRDNFQPSAASTSPSPFFIVLSYRCSNSERELYTGVFYPLW